MRRCELPCVDEAKTETAASVDALSQKRAECI